MNRVLYRPATLEAFPDGVVRDAYLPCPVGQRHRLAASGEQLVGSPVIRLRPSIGPTAVFRAVRAIIVDPVERRPLRARAHVIEEVPEAFCAAPALAHGDATTSVQLVCRIGWPQAAAKHKVPGFVLGRPAGQVRPVNFLWAPHKKAPTRLDGPALKVRQAGDLVIAAGAPAKDVIAVDARPGRHPGHLQISENKANRMRVVHACDCKRKRLGRIRGWVRRVARNALGAS